MKNLWLVHLGYGVFFDLFPIPVGVIPRRNLRGRAAKPLFVPVKDFTNNVLYLLAFLISSIAESNEEKSVLF